jgi:dTDP-D-glucose 4,6-dehydratase
MVMGNIHDWLFVEDHAVAIDLVFHEGKTTIRIILEVLTNGKTLI